MKIAGKRFWTWISVAVLSLFVKGEMNAGLQDRPTHQEAATTARAGHKTPLGLQTHSKSSAHKTVKGSKITSADKRGYKLASKHAPMENKTAVKRSSVKMNDASSPKLAPHKMNLNKTSK